MESHSSPKTSGSDTAAQHPHPNALPKGLREAFAPDEAEFFLHALSELAPAYFFAKNPEGRYIYANDAFVSICNGKCREEIIGATAWEVFEPDRAKRADDEDNEVMTSGKSIVNRINRDRVASGEERYLNVSKVPVFNHDGVIIGLVGVLFDMTQQLKNEQRLLELNQEIDRKNATLESDLLLAREVQRAFMGFESGWNPQIPLEIARQYHPSMSIGGDLLIVEEQKPGLFTVFLSDVMGHGTRSALITGVLRGLYVELKEMYATPGALLSELNQRYLSLFQAMDSTVFVTSIFAVIDCGRMEMTLASAGHHDPVHFECTSLEAVKRVHVTRSNDPAIGILHDFSYAEVTIALNPADLLFFYTDGLWETRYSEHEYLNEQTLVNWLQARADIPPEPLLSALMTQISQYTPQLEDDISMVAIRVKSRTLA